METPRKALRNIHLENVAVKSTPLRIPPSPFMKSLGCGTGVNVYKLERSPKHGEIRSPWAVKRISRNARVTGHSLFNTRIQEEAKILGKLSHPNIVGFRGIQKTGDGVDSLALECCETCLGTILEHRSDDDMGPLPSKNCLKMVFDIAKALDYLHNKAQLLHGDLKSYNILVKGDFQICKLCDFGVSIPLDENGVVDFKKNPDLEYVGTTHWSAPEVLDKELIIDQKADIFSFGLVIYETIALCVPHTLNMICDESKENELGDDSMEDEMDYALGTRPPLPEGFNLSDDYNAVVELFYCCTNDTPDDRPIAKDIWFSLEKNGVFKDK